MPTFIVTDKSTTREIYRYSSETPIEWDGMEFATHTHSMFVEPDVPIEEVFCRRRLTKQEFFDRLGTDVVRFLLTSAKTNIDIEAWIKRLDLVTPDADGTSVDLDDFRTIAGIEALSTIMIGYGIVNDAWKDEVLK